MASLDIIPVDKLRAYGSVSTTVDFTGQAQCVKEIISTVYHLVHNKQELLVHEDDLARLSDKVNWLRFTIDHPDDYPILQDQLSDLEQSFCGKFALSSKINGDKVSIMTSFVGTYGGKLRAALSHILDLATEEMNRMPSIMANQPGPVVEFACIPGHDDPRFFIGFGTDRNTHPAIVFQLGMESDEDAESKMGHFLTHVTVRLVVRIRLSVPKQGQSSDKFDESTVSIWARVPGRPQPVKIQAPEPCSKPGGQIRLWVSDFLSNPDDTLPERMKRPYQAQAAYDDPNFSIPYSTITDGLKRLVIPGVKPPTSELPTVQPSTVKPPTIKGSPAKDTTTGSRRYSTMVPVHPAALGFRLGAGARPIGCRHAGLTLSRSVGGLSRLLRK